MAAYTNPMQIAKGLVLDFTVEGADTALDSILGVSSSGQVTAFSSIPRARVSGGGNLTEATSSVLTITGGAGAVLTSALTIEVKVASGGQSGYLSSTDWNTFNNKLGTSLASARLFVGNGSNVATAVDVTGDVTISNAGVTSIAAGAIINADINASAAIAQTKMAALSASLVMATNGSGFATTVAGFTTTIAGFLTTISSNVQNQLNTKLTVTLTSPASGDIITYNGVAWVNSATPAGTLPVGGTANQILRKINSTNYNTEWHTLVAADLTDVSSTAAELNKLTGVTTTATQFNYLNTTTSNVQTQIDGKLTNILANNYMLVGNGSNLAVPLAPGTDGYILMSVGGVPTWQPSPIASGLITASGYTMNTARMLGRTTIGVGAIQEITISNGITLSATSLKLGGALTGATTISGAGFSLGITNLLNYDLTGTGTMATTFAGVVTFTGGDDFSIIFGSGASNKVLIIGDTNADNRLQINEGVDTTLTAPIFGVSVITSFDITTPFVTLKGGGVSAAEFRFFEPDLVNYSAFKAGVQSADVTYTWPTGAPASNGYVLSATTGGVMSWVSKPSNAAAAQELMKSDGTNAVACGLSSTSDGSIALGLSGVTAGTSRGIDAVGTEADILIDIAPKGASWLQLTVSDTGTNNAPKVFQISRQSSGTTAAGFGLTQIVRLQNASGTFATAAGEWTSKWTVATAGSETMFTGYKALLGGSLIDYLSMDLGNIALLSGAGSFGSGVGVIYIANATTPSSTNPTNGIVIHSKDSSDGSANATLALYLEQNPEATGTFTQSHRLKIWINGTEYWMSLDAV